MARIRSIHPGQWADEAFVELSFPARLLAIGLRNEADDQGVFEWKPKTLKMKLFPADNVDIAPLLDELVAQDQVRRFEIEGRAYGAIRNFRRWQRMDKPKAWHPLPESLREYVRLSAKGGDETGPEEDGPSPTDAPADPPKSPTAPIQVAEQSPTGRRIAKQREDVGGKREDTQAITETGFRERPPPLAPPSARPPRSDQAAIDALIRAADDAIFEHFGRRRPRPHRDDAALAADWHAREIEPGRLAAILDKAVGRWASQRDDLPVSLKLFAEDVDREEPRPQYPRGIATETDRRWFDRLGCWLDRKLWPEPWGPTPEDPACEVPEPVLRARGLEPPKRAA